MSNTTTLPPPLSSLPLDTSSWVNRFFLVGSNVGAFLPLFYLGKRVRPFYTVVDAFVLTLVGFLASVFMHLCDDDKVDGSHCIASDALLMEADVVMVNELVIVALMYSVPNRLFAFKSIAYVLYLIVNVLLYDYYNTEDDWDMAAWGGFVFGVALSFHMWYRCVLSRDFDHYVQRHLQPGAIALFALTAGSGLTLRFIGNAYYGLYTSFHSLWHLLGFASEYFFFRIHDVEGLWTFETMNPCSVGYDVAAADGDEACEKAVVGVFTGGE
jgi:hypothetical protein